MFIAGTQHAAQPKGQELTFSKCLCRLPFLCGFFKGQTEQGGWKERRGENLFRLHVYSQESSSILAPYYRH